MKISRQKKVQKHINFYVNNFGFRVPYQIIIDGTYCFAALKNQHDIQDQLPKYFQEELKLLTTPCIILETEQLGAKVFGAMIIVKKFAIHKCAHTSKPVSGSECIKSMIRKNRDQRYIIATQDRELQKYIRLLSGVPLLYLHQKTPVLEQPSPASLEAAKNNAGIRFGLSVAEQDDLANMKQKSGLLPVVEKTKKKKKKGGPNPLSCKKKQKKVAANPPHKHEKIIDGKIRKRKRVRIPDHVRQEFQNSI